MNHYETVFILNPVLSEAQIKEAVEKFENFLTSKGAEMVAKEDWGLKKLAYSIQNKKSGFYHLFEFKAPGDIIESTVRLEKEAIAWAEKRRAKLNSKKA